MRAEWFNSYADQSARQCTRRREPLTFIVNGNRPRRTIRGTRKVRRPAKAGRYIRTQRTVSSLKKRDAFRRSLPAVAFEDRVLIVDTEERAPRGTGKRVRQHLLPVAQHEPRTVNERRRQMPQLYPPLGPPAQELYVA